MKGRWTIYCHTHIESGRRYIGLTKKTMMARWNGHVNLAKRSNGKRSHFAAAIKKYGKDTFSHEVLEICHSLEVANLAEECWIEFFETRNPSKGFNLMKGGAHTPHSIRRNPWDNPVYREKQLSRDMSYLQDSRVRANNKAALNTKESKIRRTKISKEINSRPDVVAKKIAASKAIWLDPEKRARISSSMIGRTHITSDETRAKLAEIGRNQSAETRAKIATKNSLRERRPETTAKIVAYHAQKFQERVDSPFKVCRHHGPVPKTECYIGKLKSGKPRIICRKCMRKRREVHTFSNAKR